MLAIFFLQPILLGCWLVRIPDVKAALELDNTELSIGIMGAPTGTLLILAFAGRWFTRIGARRGLFIGFTGFSTAMYLIGHMPNLPTLFVALALVGAAMAFTELGMNLSATHIERMAGKLMMNTAHGCWSAGLMLGSLLGIIFAKFGLSLATTSLIIALLELPLAFWLINRLPHSDPAPKANLDTVAKSSFLRPPLALVVIAAYLFGITFVEGAVSDWGTIYLRELLHDPLAPEAGYSIFVFTGCLTIGRFLGDWSKARIGQVTLARLLGGLCLGGALLVISGSNVPLAFVGFALMGLGAAVGFPLAISAAGNLPGQTSVHLSFLTAIALSGFLISPPIIGLLADTFSIRLAFAAVIPTLILSYVCAAALRDRHPVKPSDCTETKV